MTNSIAEARHALLAPAGIADTDAARVLDHLMGRAVDLGELFFQHQRSESWVLEDGIVKDGSYSVDRGVGVRAVAGEKTGFAYAEDIVLPALNSAADAARSITRSGSSGAVAVPTAPVAAQPRYRGVDPLASQDERAKVALLELGDRAAPPVTERRARSLGSPSCW